MKNTRCPILIKLSALLLLTTTTLQPALHSNCLVSAATLLQKQQAPSNNEMITNLSKLFPDFPTTGPIDETTCDIEQLESANEGQLHVILAELMRTSFFRNFAVDLSSGCPLQGWVKGNKTKKIKDTAAAATEKKVEEQSTASAAEPECAGGLEDADSDAEPACHVDLDGGMFGGASTTSFQPSAAASASSSQSSSSNPEPDEEEYECEGNSEELDEDAPPLCSLATDDDSSSSTNNNPFFSLDSAALHSISTTLSNTHTWQSESQQATFDWNRPSDPVVLDNSEEPPCDDEAVGNLPKTFWLDVCSQIKTGEGMSIVNLQANPERNTGYNGTHIWNAIYQENCLAVDGVTNEPMCYEERVLYRLLSGLHTSTTLSIAKNYYPPSKKKGRVGWEANPQYFIDKFADSPDHLRNLHFSYVVLLRALKKASPFLYNYEMKTGDILDDEMATILLRRLLDTAILQSCHGVFTAFDESLMFKDEESSISLQENFKGVFHNVSSILDCVQCQQCKLHGKMAMLGYGAALKVLFLPEELIGDSLSRNEIVAFLNTIAKMSESIREVRELTQMYWATHTRLEKSDHGTAASGIDAFASTAGLDAVEVLDAAVGAVSSLASQGFIDDSTEAKLIQQAFERHPELMVLSKHYGNDLRKFLTFLPNIDSNMVASSGNEEPDAIVIGTGLAGLSATLNILDRGGKVILIEKELRMGGNSNKASSGINACCPQNSTYGDYIDSFKENTAKSAGSSAQLDLIQTLVENSGAAVEWLKERVGVDLSVLSQLGGHSYKRTHRPKSGMVGAEIIYNIQRAVKSYEKSGMVTILMGTRVTSLKNSDTGAVIGVEAVTTTKDGTEESKTILAPNVILATGGFASDRNQGSYLEQYRPELMKMPATAGEFSTGDGITLGTSVGAGLVDMDKVQIHPTGWVDPSDPTNPGKILAGELMRGVGGILINREGKRFCNELGTRAYVTDKMFSHDPQYAKTNKWNVTNEDPTFSLVLSASAAANAKKHVDHYLNKGLLTKIEGVTNLAKWMNIPLTTVKSTLLEYQSDANKGIDMYGKVTFNGVPQNDLDSEVFYAGTVTPVLHYCMGGLTIDKNGSVLDENRQPIPGLHAAGEVSGGVHGDNRLGGNSLLECTVYGTIVGKKIPIKPHEARQAGAAVKETSKPLELPTITLATLEEHNSEDDCWIAINGKVYDLTDFAEEHPAGPESIIELAGQDGTEAFEAVHSEKILEDFDPVGLITL